MPVIYCEKGLPRPDKSGLAMTDYETPVLRREQGLLRCFAASIRLLTKNILK